MARDLDSVESKSTFSPFKEKMAISISIRI